jgi:hypothetical protein
MICNNCKQDKHVVWHDKLNNKNFCGMCITELNRKDLLFKNNMIVC